MCSENLRPPFQPRPANLMRPAAVVKLVYTRRSGRRALTGVEVRVLSAALEPVHSERTLRSALELGQIGPDRLERDRDRPVTRHPRSKTGWGSGNSFPFTPASTSLNRLGHLGCGEKSTNSGLFSPRLRRLDPTGFRRGRFADRVTTSPVPRPHERPRNGCGRRASASRMRGGSGRCPGTERGLQRARPRWRGRATPRGPRARAA